MQLGELPQQARREVGSGGDGHQLQLAFFQALSLRHRHGVAVQDVEDFAGGVGQFAAILGQRYLLAHLFQQRRAHRVDELLHLHGDRRLGQVKRLRGAGEAAQAGDGFEDFQLAKSGVVAHGELDQD